MWMGACVCAEMCVWELNSMLNGMTCVCNMTIRVLGATNPRENGYHKISPIINYEWFWSAVGTYDTTFLLLYWLWMQYFYHFRFPVSNRILANRPISTNAAELNQLTNPTIKNLVKQQKTATTFSLYLPYGSFRVFLPPNTVTWSPLLPPLPLLPALLPAGSPVTTVNILLLRFPGLARTTVWINSFPVPAKSSTHPNSPRQLLDLNLVGNERICSPRRRGRPHPHRNRPPICDVSNAICILLLLRNDLNHRHHPPHRRTKGRTGGPSWVPRWAKRELCGTRSTGTGSGEQVHVQSKKGIYERAHIHCVLDVRRRRPYPFFFFWRPPPLACAPPPTGVAYAREGVCVGTTITAA